MKRHLLISFLLTSPAFAQQAPAPAPAAQPAPLRSETATPAAQAPMPSSEQTITARMAQAAAKGDQAAFDAGAIALEKQGNAAAFVALGQLYNDLPTPSRLHVRHPEAAADYFLRALDAAQEARLVGPVLNGARIGLARLILAGRITNHDYSYAVGLLEEAAMGGDASAPYILGRRYELGYGGKGPDYAKAEYWYRYALRGQSGEAAIALASLYRRGYMEPPAPTAEKEMVTLGLTQLTRRADGGDATAAFRLGRIYATGNGVPRDLAKAETWYKLAAGRGSVGSWKQLAFLAGREKGDHVQAAAYMQQAAEAGSVNAAADLARSLIQPEDYYLKVDRATAQTWLERAATVGHIGSMNIRADQLIAAGHAPEAIAMLEEAGKRGSVESYYTLYRLFKTGQGIAKDETRARSYFNDAIHSTELTIAEKGKLAGVMLEPAELVFNPVQGVTLMRQSAEAGSLTAMGAMADLALAGRYVTKDPAQAAAWRQKASNAGDIASTLELSRYHAEGLGLPRDPKTAYRLLTTVLRNIAPDDAAGMLLIGRAYIDGKVVLRDMEEAAKWLKKSSAAGNPEALVAYGRIVKWGALRDEAPEACVGIFRRAAAGGSFSALTELAMLYSSGMYVPQDQQTALTYFRLAAANGSSEAMRQMGLAYLGGMGVAPDRGQAQTWLAQAAGSGNAMAMLDLGNLYAEDNRMQEAWGWWRNSADSGNPDAMYILAVATRTGIGQPQDAAASQRYLDAAAKLGNYPARRDKRQMKAAHG